jgi:nicotinamidase/pyrazinamidase
MQSDADSYSAFRNNWDLKGERPHTGLAGYLKERGIENVFLCGLARDVCVQWTAEDATEAGFVVRFLWEATRPVDKRSDDTVRRSLESKGVEIVDRERMESFLDVFTLSAEQRESESR